MSPFVKEAAIAIAVLIAMPSTARAWDRDRARPFATLPAGASGPEGLEVDGEGHVYVATFGFTAPGPVAGEGHIFVFDEHGRPLRDFAVAGSSSHLLGLRFHPTTRALLVVDFGNSQVLSVDPVTGTSTVFMTLPDPQVAAGLNDLTFDSAGNVYVSDSFRGIVWRTGSTGGVGTPWVDSALLRTAGIPPFGANGLRFNRSESAMFVANTGDDTVIEIPVTASQDGPVPGAPSVFANSINGADGLLVDRDGNLWVVANQADEIVVLDPTGKVIAKLGDFGGDVEDGSPLQLLFPASARFLDDDLLVTNLALDLRLFGAPTVDSQWCAQVTRYTVSRLPARLK